MIIKSVDVEEFRAFKQISFSLGQRITAIAGRNATQKTTVLGMIGQPFSISLKNNAMYGCKTIDGYNFKSQFREKFKISPLHDKIGTHRWTINLHQNVNVSNSYSVVSIPRKQKGKQESLRFWNAKSRSKGTGYIQMPVYFLSLSRLFPIGEAGKTKKIEIKLSPEEENYCINQYKTILSIQDNSTSSVGLEKGGVAKTFTGVTSQTHDIFTNSAGECNITKIILAILSFRRLKEKFGKDYKGGILLIDEIESTLYPFSQKKIIEFLYRASAECKVQIIFTTHSPIVLKEINKLQRREIQKKGKDLPKDAYECSIVYLEPSYDDSGNRTIQATNIIYSHELNSKLCDINLSLIPSNNKINIYCEDDRAKSFVRHLLNVKLNQNVDSMMSFIDVNLGWSNYIQLVGKKVPEFLNNLIILDGDVLEKEDYTETKRSVVESSKNIIFLPLVIEKDLFTLLKKHSVFNNFQKSYVKSEIYTYDMCFRDWPMSPDVYKTVDFKNWFETLLNDVKKDTDLIFDFWMKINQEKCDDFMKSFIQSFNILANKNEVDCI